MHWQHPYFVLSDKLLGQSYAQQHGQTPQQVLESAIAPNSGADAQTLLFIMAFAGVMFGCLNGVRSIVREAPIYRRERMVNLGIAPYMLLKNRCSGRFLLITTCNPGLSSKPQGSISSGNFLTCSGRSLYHYCTHNLFWFNAWAGYLGYRSQQRPCYELYTTYVIT